MELWGEYIGDIVEQNGNVVCIVKLMNKLQKKFNKDSLVDAVKSGQLQLTNVVITEFGEIVRVDRIKRSASIGEPYGYEKCVGGILGAIIGDAMGVPYEFHDKDSIPEAEYIGTEVIGGFQRSYSNIPLGTWSDDSSGILCLIKTLVECGKVDQDYLMKQLYNWARCGEWAVDNHVFDIGNQTGRAINAYSNGCPAKDCGKVVPDGKGNGALMRVLPVAIYYRGNREAIIKAAHNQSVVTHGNIDNGICCALYCLVANELLAGRGIREAIDTGINYLDGFYKQHDKFHAAFEKMGFKPHKNFIGQGTGYVLDSLNTAFMILLDSAGYEDCIKAAIKLGEDADTTACIVGGLAGIYYSIADIPEEWQRGWLREYDVALAMAEKLYLVSEN